MIRPPIVPLVFLALLVWLSGSPGGPRSPRVSGRVVDATTHSPLADAIVTAGDKELRSDSHGHFVVDVEDCDRLRFRAHGYLRADLPVQAFRDTESEIALTPFRPKALYLSVYGIGSKTLRTAALSLVRTTELNALVIDVKGIVGLFRIAARSAWRQK